MVAQPTSTDFVDRHVGRRLRDLRKRQGLSQADLAARVGVSFQQIAKYETAGSRIGVSTLHALAAALGVSSATLLEGLGPAGRSPGPATSSEQAMMQSLIDAEGGLDIARAYLAIGHADMRRNLVILAQSAAAIALSLPEEKETPATRPAASDGAE